MDYYRHRQPAHLVVALLVGAAVFTISLSFTVRPDEQFMRFYFYGLTLLLLIVTRLFASLNVTVNEQEVVAAFGPGWFKRRINLGEIESVESVTNKWWWGWGIRRIPNGWMYNVSGLDAVELKLKKGTVFRIGTDEPEKLEEAVKNALDLSARHPRKISFP